MEAYSIRWFKDVFSLDCCTSSCYVQMGSSPGYFPTRDDGDLVTTGVGWPAEWDGEQHSVGVAMYWFTHSSRWFLPVQLLRPLLQVKTALPVGTFSTETSCFHKNDYNLYQRDILSEFWPETPLLSSPCKSTRRCFKRESWEKEKWEA